MDWRIGGTVVVGILREEPPRRRGHRLQGSGGRQGLGRPALVRQRPLRGRRLPGRRRWIRPGVHDVRRRGGQGLSLGLARGRGGQGRQASGEGRGLVAALTPFLSGLAPPSFERLPDGERLLL